MGAYFRFDRSTDGKGTSERTISSKAKAAEVTKVSACEGIASAMPCLLSETISRTCGLRRHLELRIVDRRVEFDLGVLARG